MKRIVGILIALLGLSTCSEAAVINVNVVGWPWTQPAYDTTIVAAPGDSLIIFNATTGFMGFLKEVNNVRVDTLPGVFQGDTADVHVLNWNHNTLGYYIHTQVWDEYGLRCHINFLNTAVALTECDFNMTLTPLALHCFTNYDGTLTLYSMNGSLVLSERLTRGSNYFHFNECSEILIAEVLLDDGRVITKKFYSSGL